MEFLEIHNEVVTNLACVPKGRNFSIFQIERGVGTNTNSCSNSIQKRCNYGSIR